MNKLIKIAIAAAATLTLGFAALAHADEVAAPGAKQEHDCKGGKDGKRFGRHGHGRMLLNNVTAADLKQVGLTDAQIQQFEAAKPFDERERGKLRKLNLINRDQFRQLRKIMKARLGAPSPDAAPTP